MGGGKKNFWGISNEEREKGRKEREHGTFRALEKGQEEKEVVLGRELSLKEGEGKSRNKGKALKVTTQPRWGETGIVWQGGGVLLYFNGRKHPGKGES